MSNIFWFFIVALISHEVYSDTIFCQKCKNEECEADTVSATTCNGADVNTSYIDINAAYKQNYSAPGNVTSFDCIYINTTFVLTNNDTENFTYKGCVEYGFNVKAVQPNPLYITQENRSIFEACGDSMCNNFPPTPPPKVLNCYICEDQTSCQLENLKSAPCSETNVARNYNLLSKHYKIYFPPTGSTDYECLSINSTLTGDNSSKLVLKGCIQSGFDACDLKFSPDWYNKEVKDSCKICSRDLCNRNSTSSIKFPTLFFFFGIGVLMP
ncbi:hypothetical protein ACFFRR_010031 [Megaselia abdita]